MVSKKQNIKPNIKLGFIEHINSISTSKLFIGLIIIFLNLGSRYIELKLTKGQEMMIKNVAREMLIFSIVFIGTKDIITALTLTAVFIILSNFVFNENSKYCLMPKKYKEIENLMDLDGDGVVSKEELEKAYKILEKAKNKEKNNLRLNAINNLN